jgi:hypothetical protein
MARWKKMVLALGVILILGGAVLFAYLRWQAVPDPTYAGVPLSVLMHRIYGPRPIVTAATLSNSITVWQKYNAERNTAIEALNSVKPGREALPLITNWLTTPPLSWKQKLGERLLKHNADYLNLSADRRRMALSFLSAYPIDAAPELLPCFAITAQSTNRADIVLTIAALTRLCQSGTNIDIDAALKILMPLKYSEQPEARSSLRSSQGTMDYYHLLSVSTVYSPHNLQRSIDSVDPARAFVPLYVLELAPEAERVGAAMELAAHPRMPERAVPLLIANLGSTNRSVQENCAIALGKYGDNARSALPALTNLLAHPRARIRTAASNAIVGISKPLEAVAASR